jgi:disulfide bond formation protein DsbB
MKKIKRHFTTNNDPSTLGKDVQTRSGKYSWGASSLGGQILLKYIPYATFFIALMSMLISLYFSEIMKLPPCTLCWYQRIAMYPIVPITIVGILLKDKKFPLYVLPLSIIGLLLAIYHNFLVWGIIPERSAPCTAGVPCNVQEWVLFGFITIPFLSMLSFAFISVIMLIYAKGLKKNVKRS